MKVLIKASTSSGWVYHSTKTEESAMSIIDKGFKGNEVCLTSSLDQAQGYGPICIRSKVSDLERIHIENINDDYSFDHKDYSSECRGIMEPVHSELNTFIYYIWDVSALNRTVEFERYPEGGR